MKSNNETINQPDTEKVAREMSPEAAIKRLTAFANALYATSLDDGKKMIADIEVITHLREQLQLSQSQVGRCVEDVKEIKQVTSKGSMADAMWINFKCEQLLNSLPSTPNYVKRVEELEKNMAWGRSEFVKYRTALNRIAHPDTYPSGGTPDKEIARRALLLGMEITPLPKDAYDSLRERVRGLEGALKPFVKFYERLSDGRLKVPKSGIWYGLDCGTEKEAAITIEDFQQATKSLSEGEG